MYWAHGRMRMGQAWHSSWRDAKGQICITVGLGYGESPVLPHHGTPRGQASHKLPGSLAFCSGPEGAGVGWRLRTRAVSPAPAPYSACSELTDFTIPSLPTPRALPRVSAAISWQTGDSSLSRPRGNPMPWCQQRVSLGVWGMGLRLCRAQLPEGVEGL